ARRGVAARLGGVGEEPGALEHEVHAHVGPLDLLEVALRRHGHALAVHIQVAVLGRNGALVGAVGRVVLEQMRVGRRVEEVVDGHDLDLVGMACLDRAEHQASDAAKSVDADLRLHVCPPRRSGCQAGSCSCQLFARSTARAQPSRSASTRFQGIAGSNRRSTRHCPAMSSGLFQTPTASPARYAAPSAVVSVMAGRTTGTPATSAWNCRSRLFRAAPPSTRSSVTSAAESARIASSRSATWKAMPSSAARATWAAV